MKQYPAAPWTRVALALLASACTSNPGLPKDDSPFARFPLAMLPSPQGDALVVAGTNFDRSHRAGSLRVIDTVHDRWVAGQGLEVPSYAGGMAWLPQTTGGSALVVTSRENDGLTLVDLAAAPTPQVGWSMACGTDPDTGACDTAHTVGSLNGAVTVGNDPIDVVLQPDPATNTGLLLAHTIATNDGRVQLFEVDPAKQGAEAWKPLDAITLNTGLQTIRRSSLTGRLYVSDARVSAVHVYHVEPTHDPTLPRYRIALESAVAVAGSSVADYGRGMALSHDQATLYVAWRSPNAVALIDIGPDNTGAPRNRVLDIVPLGGSPSELAVAPTGPGGRDLIYAACYAADSLWVLDPAIRAVVAKIALPHAPYGVATVDVPGVGWKLYTGVFNQHRVAVVPLEPGPQQHTLAGFVEAP